MVDLPSAWCTALNETTTNGSKSLDILVKVLSDSHIASIALH